VTTAHERTLVLVKPDAVRQGLAGEVLQRVVAGFRSLGGATEPTLAAPGTIRGDLGRDWGTAVQQHLVHGSDSTTSAVREIGIWFPGL
jgi:nucleoside-diphosphate kinase